MTEVELITLKSIALAAEALRILVRMLAAFRERDYVIQLWCARITRPLKLPRGLHATGLACPLVALKNKNSANAFEADMATAGTKPRVSSILGYITATLYRTELSHFSASIKGRERCTTATTLTWK